MSIREFDLIDRYFSRLSALGENVKCGIGDDAAILEIPEGKELLVSVDTLLENTHFLPKTSAYDIGYKALAVNISDIAAMGAEPCWATLALTIPAIDHQWLQEFARGFATLAAEYNISLIGGDTSKGPLSITVQIMAMADKGRSLLRSGAQVGDLIYVSGCLGAAGLACKSLLENTNEKSVPAYCLERLHRPVPRVELARQIADLASAGIDISDGLAADLAHVLTASHVSADVQLQSLPVCEDLKKLEDENLVWQLALAAGDDYELCFTLPEQARAELDERLKNTACPVSCIGKITEGEGIRWLDENAREVQLELDGFRHF